MSVKSKSKPFSEKQVQQLNEIIDERPFSEKQVQQLNKIIDERPFSEKQVQQLNKIIDERPFSEKQIEQLNEAIQNAITPIINKLNKLDKTLNGYIGKESEIYEIKINDLFVRYLNDYNRLYKELNLRNFYGPSNLITDFDGLFLVDYFENIKAPLFNSKGRPKNVVKAYPNTQIVIIEAKHDLDKSKIDKKLMQYFEIQSILNNSKNNQAKKDYQEMIADPEFKILEKQYNNNLYILFAAENITKCLEKYIETIYLGILDKDTYIQLTNDILANHDKKLINRVLKMTRTIQAVHPELKKYIKNFKPDYDYINEYNFTKEDSYNFTRDRNDVLSKEYHELMMNLKSYVTPYEEIDWSAFKNKIGSISNNKIKYIYDSE